jgi:hypothetical protein
VPGSSLLSNAIDEPALAEDDANTTSHSPPQGIEARINTQTAFRLLLALGACAAGEEGQAGSACG